MCEEEREADGPDDGEDAAEGVVRWAGEGVGVVIHYCWGKGVATGSLAFFLRHSSWYVFLLFLTSSQAAAKRMCKKKERVHERS